MVPFKQNMTFCNISNCQIIVTLKGQYLSLKCRVVEVENLLNDWTTTWSWWLLHCCTSVGVNSYCSWWGHGMFDCKSFPDNQEPLHLCLLSFKCIFSPHAICLSSLSVTATGYFELSVLKNTLCLIPVSWYFWSTRSPDRNMLLFIVINRSSDLVCTQHCN